MTVWTSQLKLTCILDVTFNLNTGKYMYMYIYIYIYIHIHTYKGGI